MRRPSLAVCLLALATGCIQPKYGDDAGPPPPGIDATVVEVQAGRGRRVAAGDRIRVDLLGRYQDGTVWGDGPLTFVVGRDSYPGLAGPPRVGSRLILALSTDPREPTVRLWPFQGGDSENEAYQLRRDRGPIVIEHRIRAVCRPMKVFFLQTGFGPIEADLGCWPVFRFGGGGGAASRSDRERETTALGLEVGSGATAHVTPPVRESADTARFLGPDGLHLAAREARPDLAGWLIARGLDVARSDSFGFQPLHYVGWAQRLPERFVPALDGAFAEVVDTLLAHGAQVDARVGPGRARGLTLPESQHEGQTVLALAASACADPLVARLLEQGADPNARNERGAVVLAEVARNGCPETLELLLAAGADVDADAMQGGTPLERLIAVSAFHRGHFDCARLLVLAGARTDAAAERLASRLQDPGPGGFGFANRPEARRILELLRKGP